MSSKKLNTVCNIDKILEDEIKKKNNNQYYVLHSKEISLSRKSVKKNYRPSNDLTQKNSLQYYIIYNDKEIIVSIGDIIPCSEFGRGGHANALINIVKILDLNNPTVNNPTVNKIYCGKIINYKKPNEFLFYQYIYNNITEFENFSKFICEYKGVIKFNNIYYIIIENAKNNLKNTITIDFKIGKVTYYEGENSSNCTNTENSHLKKTKLNILNSHTMSSLIGTRIGGITGINEIGSMFYSTSSEYVNNINNFIEQITLDKVTSINIVDRNNKIKKIYNTPFSNSYSICKKHLKIILSASFSSFSSSIALSIFSILDKRSEKLILMRVNPLKILDVLFIEKKINLDILYNFKEILNDIILTFIIPNFYSSRPFSFVASSFLFIIGNDANNKKVGSIKLIDFGHPVNLFMNKIKLNNSKTPIIKKSLYDYSLSIINLYFIISYFIYCKNEIKNWVNKEETAILNSLVSILSHHDEMQK